jgi:peptidyl-Asp metalloendopeptidase
MIFCKRTRPLAAAAFCTAILAGAIFDASNSNAAAAGLFGTPTAAEMRAVPSWSAGTMRDGLRGPNAAGFVRDRLVSLNLSELGRIIPLGAGAAADRLDRAKNLRGAVTLELFPGLSVTAERTDIEAPNEGGFVWVGEDRGPRHAFVTLMITDNEVLGHIQTGGKLYSIEPVSGAVHRVIEIDQGKIKDDMHAPPIKESNEKKSEAPQPSPNAVATLTPTFINVMVAHTAAARAEVGTAAQMQARINLAISLANQAFGRSGALVRFTRVGGSNEIVYGDFSLYGGNNSFNNYLGSLCDLSGFNNNGSCLGVGNNNAAKFAALRTKRNTVAADLVVLMRKQGVACGIAWEPNLNGTVLAANHIYGFSVVTSTPFYACIEANTLAHETGHNQGMNHDRIEHKLDYNVLTPPASQYNFGHVNPTKHFVTIMSYQSSCAGCTRIPYFSTPLKKYPNTAAGTPVGVAQGVGGLFGAADAVRVLNANRTIVGAYR